MFVFILKKTRTTKTNYTSLTCLPRKKTFRKLRLLKDYQETSNFSEAINASLIDDASIINQGRFQKLQNGSKGMEISRE